MIKSKECSKCNKEPVSGRFLGQDICSKCYAKVKNILDKINIL